MSHYAWHNVTESSRITTRYLYCVVSLSLNLHQLLCFISGHLFSCRNYIVKSNYTVIGRNCRHIFATMSFIAETFIFLYVGMDALDMDKWRTAKAG